MVTRIIFVYHICRYLRTCIGKRQGRRKRQGHEKLSSFIQILSGADKTWECVRQRMVWLLCMWLSQFGVNQCIEYPFRGTTKHIVWLIFNTWNNPYKCRCANLCDVFCKSESHTLAHMFTLTPESGLSNDCNLNSEDIQIACGRTHLYILAWEVI